MNHSIPRLRHLTPRRRRACQPKAEFLERRQLLNAGDLDRSFGTGGYTLAGPSNFAKAVQLQSDGKILAAGQSMDGKDFRLVRLSSSGALDPTFGTSGSVTTDFTGGQDYVSDMVILPGDGIVDERIMVVGRVDNLGQTDFGLACYLAADTTISGVQYRAGALDPRFGTSGKVMTNISTYSTDKTDIPHGVIVQEDGEIVVGGETINSSGTSDAVLVQYNTNGSLDFSFGSGGIVQTHLDSHPYNGVWDLKLLRDPTDPANDKIVTMEAPFSSYYSVMVARYNILDGSPDTNFSTDGRSDIATLPGHSLGDWEMALQTDGSAVVTGRDQVTNSPSGSFLLRYTNTGQLDPTFGTDGSRIVLFGAATGDSAYSLATEPNGKIIVSGSSGTAPGGFVARFDTFGAIDTTFGLNGDGFARDTFTDSGSNFGSPNNLILQPDGKIVVVGAARTRIDRRTIQLDFLIARYEGTSPPGITVSPTSGLVTTESGGTASFSVALTTQPTADVNISVSSSDTTEGNVSTSSLTFTSANWNMPQSVIITGVDDAFVDGDIAYTIVLGLDASTDPDYIVLDPADVSVTNTDNEVPPTKFYVVNDGSPDKTYECGSTGTAVKNYDLNSGNTAPRGAASTAAGDKVWVVDSNKNVYVYNTGGSLLGSWTAGSLASNATVEGIATNGTDVWIVDARQDKVFRYTGAASRLSGSQNAAGTPISLNSGNSSPKDIATDGTSLWVVNDSTTDKVFKYNLSGTLLGSWTISGAGSSPTGITLDPSGGGSLWIVDNGTDRVYQFDNARGLTSGSLAPSTSFALAAGNTNPQGIADPPAPALGASRAANSASKSTRSLLPPNVGAISIVGRPETSTLMPMMPMTDQDLTVLASELIRSGTKRTRISTWG